MKLRLASLGLLIALWAAPAFAQSCAMCYTTVAGGGKGVIHALQGAIIVLLIPPVLLFSALTILLFRWRTSASRQTPSGTALSAQP